MPEVLSVAELNSRVKELFAKTSGLNDIWVTGEISGLKKYPSGYYFVLKDPASEIHAVMFKSARARIDFEPQENMKVRAFGSIGLFVPRGTYQFIVEVMDKSGVGDRYVAFEALKKKLSEEGLFSESHKRQIPAYPKTIGVVTSQSGAVIHDIITTSASRYSADILLAPAMVQGEGAAESIVAGIKLLNKADVDVIIVGRGGGSIEDLWPFNEEIVARAIYESKAPVVSAVGHETDFTIADFVSDVRAPTPTGAAAIILRDRAEIDSEIRSYMTRLNRAMLSQLDRMNHSFSILDSKLDPQRAMDSMDMYGMHLDELSRSADRLLMEKVRRMRLAFDSLDARLRPSVAMEDITELREYVETSFDRVRSDSLRILENSTSRFVSVSERPESLIRTALDRISDQFNAEAKHLDGLNPYNVLNRGYSMITDGDGKVITSVANIDAGDGVTIRFRDGSAEAEIKSKEMKK